MVTKNVTDNTRHSYHFTHFNVNINKTYERPDTPSVIHVAYHVTHNMPNTHEDKQAMTKSEFLNVRSMFALQVFFSVKAKPL